MLRIVRAGLTLLIIAIIAGAPFAYWRCGKAQLRNFQIVRAGVLYRSGQLSLGGLKQIIEEHGIRSVVSLRYADEGEELPPDAREEIFCRKHGINYYRIRPQTWRPKHGEVPAQKALNQFFALMGDHDNYPVLIHCFAGAHRTGSFCAAYRMECEGWTNEEALQEMRHSGYTTLEEDEDIFEYLSGYQLRRQSH